MAEAQVTYLEEVAFDLTAFRCAWQTAKCHQFARFLAINAIKLEKNPFFFPAFTSRDENSVFRQTFTASNGRVARGAVFRPFAALCGLVSVNLNTKNTKGTKGRKIEWGKAFTRLTEEGVFP